MKFFRKHQPMVQAGLISFSASLVCLTMIGWASAAAQGGPQFTARTWEVADGLPNNTVQAIAQTSDGYLWVGTHEGLARFDGTHFKIFDKTTTPQLTNWNITALCREKAGALWIGSGAGGVVRLKDGGFRHYGRSEGLAGDNIRAIYESHDGSIWIGTSTGLSQFRNGAFSNYTRLYFTREPSLVSSIINGISEDNEGGVWVASSGGLNYLKGRVIEEFTTSNGLPNRSIRSVFRDRDGRLWIGSNSGLTVYENGAFRTYGTEDGLSDDFVTSVCEDRQGNLWVGNYGGLNRFAEGAISSYLNDKQEPYDQVNTIVEDREGNVWVGSKEGLIQFTPKRFSVFSKQQGLSYNNVMSVREDRSSNLWIATWGGGLNKLKDGKVTVYGPRNGLISPIILSTCEARDGSLWIGAEFDAGLAHLAQGKFQRFTARDGLIPSGLKAIHEDRTGALWIGTSQGLNRWQHGQFAAYTSTNSTLPADVVRAILEDHDGKIWFGTDGGLSRWQDGHFVNYTTREGLSDNVVNALYEDKEKNLWIGTDAGGLNRYRDGKFTCCDTQHGLFSDRVLEILEDDYGQLWMTCYKGVFCVRKQELDDLDHGRIDQVHCSAYGKADGMESPQCNGVAQPAGWKTHDGRLWFPTTKGLVVAEPNLRHNEVPPPVLIERIAADNKTIEMGEWPLASAFPALTLPPGNGEFEVQYSSLSFSSPERDRFKYKLEGADSDWIDAGSRRLAHYNNLYPGTYRFLVKAANNDGVWNEIGVSLPLVLKPHVWQTKWFLALAVLAIIAMVGGLARYMSWKKLRQKLALLELQHSLDRERARIARDIHDDLGCSLTHITLLSEESQIEGEQELQANTRKISATAREMARSLEEIVWAINPEHDTLEGLVEYLTQSADEFLEDTTIHSRLKAPNVLPDYSVPADVRHELYFAFKEALNNSVRHARASEIQIEFLVEPGRFQIIIIDDGSGFDPGSARPEGNGLKNMRRRLEAIGGQFEIRSRPREGTRIQMTIRLKESEP